MNLLSTTQREIDKLKGKLIDEETYKAMSACFTMTTFHSIKINQSKFHPGHWLDEDDMELMGLKVLPYGDLTNELDDIDEDDDAEESDERYEGYERHIMERFP